LEFYIDDVILEQSGRVKSYQTNEGYAVPLPTGTSVNYFYNIKDWLGTNRVVLDATGTRVNVTDHYAYGLKMPARNYSADVEGNRYQFTGHQFDGETNYEYHGARYYNRELGRYMSVDPLAHQAFGWSPYRYCFDNPIKFIDPDGRFETRKEARAYRKKHDISGRIHKDSDGDGFSIDDKKNHQSYTKGDQSDIDNKFTDAEGIVKSDLVTANRKQNCNNENESGLTWKTPTGLILEGLGSNIIPTRQKTSGATKGTSLASSYLSKKFPQQLNKTKPKLWKTASKIIPNRILGLPLKSPVAGRLMGRAVPIVGRAFILYDVISSGVFVLENLGNFMTDSPEIFWGKARENVTTIGMYDKESQTDRGF
jgi:RHS repeat-associated protein